MRIYCNEKIHLLCFIKIFTYFTFVVNGLWVGVSFEKVANTEYQVINLVKIPLHLIRFKVFTLFSVLAKKAYENTLNN